MLNDTTFDIDELINSLFKRVWWQQFLAVNRQLNLLFGILGIVGYCILLMVLQRKPFGASSFTYHRIISAVELIFSFSSVWDYVGSTYFQEQSSIKNSYILTLISSSRFAFSDLLNFYSDGLTLIVCVERCIALYLPRTFAKVNRKEMAYVLVVSAFVTNTFMAGPYLLENSINETENHTFETVENAFWPELNEYVKICVTIFQLIKAIIISVSLAASVTGLLRFRKRRRNLTARSQHVLRAMKQDVQLCLLQICLCVPLVLNLLSGSVQENLRPQVQDENF